MIASNRLPTSLRRTDAGLESFPSSGGLASALAGFQGDGDFVWVGWPGCVGSIGLPGGASTGITWRNSSRR